MKARGGRDILFNCWSRQRDRATATAGGCQEFNRRIDDIRVYNRLLSGEEVEELYEAGSGM
ncbi:MAG: hypothetical protein JSV99_09830 [Planctomycetota bacterium]|nr:MAG: hypothetical protein JSV99_09830 [Planctomycetota bacterium]